MARIVFIERDPGVKYAPMALSAWLKAHGHEADLVLAPFERDVVAAVLRRVPDVVAFSVTTGRHRWALRVARAIRRRRRVVTVFGGPHATWAPELVEDPAVDVVCRGEGELALQELLDRVHAGRPYDDVANLWVKAPDGAVRRNDVRPLLPDLDELPFADRELYLGHPAVLGFQRDAFFLLVGRGCPHHCTYCYNDAWHSLYAGKGRRVRRRSVGHVLREVQAAQSRYRLRGVRFEDDTLLASPAWARELLDAWGRHVALPFVCFVRADEVTGDMAERLARAGCRGVMMGIECADDDLRRRVLRKELDSQQIVDAVGRLRAADLPIQSYNIVGIPGGSLEHDLETLRFNARLGVDHAWCSLMTPYPGTPIREIAAQAGLLPPGVDDAVLPSYFDGTTLPLPARREVVNLHHLFHLGVRHPRLLPLLERALSLPATPLYQAVFRARYLWSLKRFNQIELGPFLRFLWHCRGIYDE